jgi:hypothetical protein
MLHPPLALLENTMRQETRILQNDNEIREKIALRAYELYEDRGGQNGRDIDDWLQAETDVLAEAEQQQKWPHGRKQPSKAPAATPQSSPETKRPAGSAR